MVKGADKRGFALVLALALIALSGGVLVAATREARQATRVARQTQDRVQAHWGEVSIRNALFPRAAHLVNQHAADALLEYQADRDESQDAVRAYDARDIGPINQMQVHLRLGEATFHILIRDESARVNINELLRSRQGDVVGTTRMLEDAFAHRGRKRVVRLRPFRRDGTVRSFGQVFTDEAMMDVVTALSDQRHPMHHLTCWGNGRLNLHLASDEALRLRLAGKLTAAQVEAVVDARRAALLSPMWAVLQDAGLPRDTRNGVGSLFAERTSCVSLFIASQSSTQRSHTWYVRRLDAMHLPDDVFRW